MSTPPTSLPPATPNYRLRAVVAVGACIAAIATIGSLEWSRRPTSPAATTLPAGQPVAVVIDAVRALKLVTWQFETTIDAQSVSDKWYGDATASVRAPVRYQYGVDLQTMQSADVLTDFGPRQRRYVFIVPPPTRISVEVDLARLEQTLQTSGVRWCSTNQGQLDEARTMLADRAKQTQLTADDAVRLRQVSRGQLEGLLKRILGADAVVDVRFAD